MKKYSVFNKKNNNLIFSYITYDRKMDRLFSKSLSKLKKIYFKEVKDEI